MSAWKNPAPSALKHHKRRHPHEDDIYRVPPPPHGRTYGRVDRVLTPVRASRIKSDDERVSNHPAHLAALALQLRSWRIQGTIAAFRFSDPSG